MKDSLREIREDSWKEFREAFLGSILGKHGRCLRTFSVNHGRILGGRIRRKGRDDQVTPAGTITLGEEPTVPFGH